MTSRDPTSPSSISGYRTDLRDRLPLPLARLYRRTFNAKSTIERHHGAYFLLEALVKTAASAQVAVYLAAGMRDADADAKLARLARPAFGDWVSILRDVSTRTSSLDPHPFPEVASVAALIREKRADLPRVKAALVEMGARVEGVPSFGGDRPSVLDLFDRLPAYRNQAIAHSALRPDEAFYVTMGQLLLEAALEVVERVPLLGNAVLSYVAEVRETRDGIRLVDVLDLTGPEALLATSPGGDEEPKDGPLRPGRLYLKKGARYLDLHPLLVCGSAPPDASVAYLNRSLEGRVEVLDYVSGEATAAPALLEDHRRILGRILRHDVTREGLERLVPADAVATPTPDAAGGARRFGEFDVTSLLGEGGMGTVYLAMQRSVGRPVALKVLPPALGSNEVAAARFLREVRALARADHPNVVRILHSGRTEGTYWYAMEYVEGCDLREVASSLSTASSRDALTSSDLARAVSTASERRSAGTTPLFPGMATAAPTAAPDLGEGRSYYVRIAEVFRDAALGLHHLHERGVVHRDVKPANVMLTKNDGRVVVMDLGLARLAGDASFAGPASVLGTLAYAAPEQVQEGLTGRRVDARADVYGLGASLYELATGRAPYAGASPTALAASVLRGPPDAPRHVDGEVPRDLDAIIRKAMEHDLARRYSTAALLAEDLDRFARGEPVSARPPSLGRLARLWIRRNAAVSAVAGAALVIAIAGLILFLTSLAAERDRAQEERDRAEGLARFMLFDLQEKLKQAGRLDLLAAVVHQTRAYYESLPAGETAPEALRAYAVAVSSLGELSKAQGDLGKAGETHESALSVWRGLVVRAPRDVVPRTELARTLLALGDVRREQVRRDEAQRLYDEANDVAAQLSTEAPKDRDVARLVAAGRERLGRMHVLRGDLEAALAELEAGHAIRKRLVEQAPRDPMLRIELATSHMDVGDALPGDIAGSLRHYVEGRTLLEQVAEVDPTNADVASSLATGLARTALALKEQGNLEAALEMYERAHRMLTWLSERDPTHLDRRAAVGMALWELAEVRFSRGNLDGALRDYRGVQKHFAAIVEIDATNRDWERWLGRSHAGVGNVLLAQGDAQTASKEYEEGHKIRSRIAERDPTGARGRRDVGFGLYLIGSALAARGQAELALESHRRSEKLRRGLVAEDPSSTRVPRDLFQSLVAIADLLPPAQAMPLYREAATIVDRLASKDAHNRAWQGDIGLVHARMSSALLATGDPPAAVARAESAVETLRGLVQLDATNAEWQAELIVAWTRLSHARQATGDPRRALEASREAESVAREALGTRPSVPLFRRLHALALAASGGLLAAGGEKAAALAALVDSEDILRSLTAAQPSHDGWKREHARVLASLDALRRPGEPVGGR